MSGEANPPAEPATEEVLVQLLRMRERALGFCFAALRDFHQAEDVYQEATLVVTRRIDQYRGENFERWFWKILRNCLGTQIRARRRGHVMVDSELLERMCSLMTEEAVPDPEQNVDYLVECLEKLRAKTREILEWRFLENLSCQAISRRLGRTVQATYSLIKRARRAVRDCVELRAQGARLSADRHGGEG